MTKTEIRAMVPSEPGVKMVRFGAKLVVLDVYYARVGATKRGAKGWIISLNAGSTQFFDTKTEAIDYLWKEFKHV